MNFPKSTFNRLEPLAEKIGYALAGNSTDDVAIAIGMNLGLNAADPAELEKALDIIRHSAAEFRILTMEEGFGH